MGGRLARWFDTGTARDSGDLIYHYNHTRRYFLSTNLNISTSRLHLRLPQRFTTLSRMNFDSLGYRWTPISALFSFAFLLAVEAASLWDNTFPISYHTHCSNYYSRRSLPR